MSGIWNGLRAQKKGELVTLAQDLGLHDVSSSSSPTSTCTRASHRIALPRRLTSFPFQFDDLKKSELEQLIDDHLSSNAHKYSNDTRFRHYYKRRSETSPVKREASTSLADMGGRTKRRVTKAAEEMSNVLSARDE